MTPLEAWLVIENKAKAKTDVTDQTENEDDYDRGKVDAKMKVKTGVKRKDDEEANEDEKKGDEEEGDAVTKDLFPSHSEILLGISHVNPNQKILYSPIPKLDPHPIPSQSGKLISEYCVRGIHSDYRVE